MQTQGGQKKAQWHRWGIAVALIVVSFAIGYFWIKSEPRPEIAAPLTSSSATPIEEFFGRGGPAGPTGDDEQNSNPQGVALTSSSTFAKAAAECAPEVRTADSQTVDQWIKLFLAQDSVASSSVDFENFQLQLPDGSNRRLHLIPVDPSGRLKDRELRYYKLDHEGLPERIPLTDEQTRNPSAEFLQSLKSQGTITSHQVKETKVLQDGSKLSQLMINDRIFEFQLFRAKKTFSCRRMDCQCK